jgi:hypothetical protein
MLLLDLLITVAIILVLTVGSVPSVPQIAVALLVAGGVIVAIHLGWDWAFQLFANRFSGPGERHRIGSRRRINPVRVDRTRAERRIEAMDDAALQKFIELHPRDRVAVEILCERLQARGRLADYAREMEYFLTLDNRLAIEEVCSRYHHLADIYLNELGRPDRAREMVQTIVATYPRHYQSTLARQRLRSMDESNRPGRGASESAGPSDGS